MAAIAPQARRQRALDAERTLKETSQREAEMSGGLISALQLPSVRNAREARIRRLRSRVETVDLHGRVFVGA